MKNRVALTTLIVTAALVCIFPCVYGQGDLAPSSSPTPTMKTLDQLEPRVPISSLPYDITTSGSYYVTTNLVGTAGTNGITIVTDNVTIDL